MAVQLPGNHIAQNGKPKYLILYLLLEEILLISKYDVYLCSQMHTHILHEIHSLTISNKL